MSNLFEQISRKIRLSVFRAERCSEQVLLNNWLYFIPGCIRHLRQVQKISLKGLRVKAFAELCHANSFVRGIFERKQKQLQWNSSGVLRLLWKLNIIWLNLSQLGQLGWRGLLGLFTHFILSFTFDLYKILKSWWRLRFFRSSFLQLSAPFG